MSKISEIEDAIAFLAELVQARSPNPPGDETLVAQAIIQKAAGLGLPKFACHARDPRRPNLIMTLGHGAPTLLLAAHMDTMPPGNLPSWHGDPYCLTHADGRLRGLGAADMKAAIVAMLFAGARIARAPEKTGTLTLVFSADEENGSSYGMEWLAQQGLLAADAAAMTEPAGLGENSWQRLFIAQRGHCVSWLVARGVPGHSGEPISRDQRASYAFVKALNALLEADPFADWVHPVDGTRPTVNVATMVEGGMVPFAHPETLKACLEIRVIEGMTEDLVRVRLREVIARAGLGSRVTIEPAVSPQNWISPGEQVRDKSLIDAAKFEWRKVLGREPILAVMSAGTDSSHANAAGIPALPAFGPGSLGVAHKPNESLPEEDIGIAIDMFETFIRAYHRETPYV
ncbi:MAG TPA: M20/M25/M40 family metallo-hydrolase [Candidatus Saccharimonadales bacterium]|nr:M20/M25/M40 family metallo-hydrolase [Candidatus Saccharimonadales bacterium]